MVNLQGAAQIGGQPQPENGEDPNEAIRNQLPPQVRPYWDQLVGIRSENAELMKTLAGYGAGLDPVSVLTTKLSALVDCLWDGTTIKGQTKMIELEIKFEQMMSQILTVATQNITQAMLAQGAQLPPAFIKQMEKQSQMIRDSRTPDG